jgi:hypothetical protein
MEVGMKVVPDVGAPVAVGVVNIVMDKYAPTYKEWVSYGLTAIGYLSAAMGWVRGDMGDFLKNLGVSSLPQTINHIYTRVTATPAAARVAHGSRMSLHAMSGIRQTTPPEFQDVRVS